MICVTCKNDVSVDAFSWRNKAKGVRSKTCKLCKKLQQQLWYTAHKASHIANVASNKANVRKWYRNYKRTLTCSRCPENHPACLDFHHRESDSKDGHVATLAQRGVSLRKLKEEIAKCDVLCANCHRKLHSEDMHP